MQTNPGKKTHGKILILKVSDTHIKCEDVVKLLGVDIDIMPPRNLDIITKW